MPDTDSLTAALDAIGKRDKEVWDYRDRMGALEAIGAAKDDVPRLLAALDAVLNLTGHARPTARDPYGEPVYWDLVPEDVREVITCALLGEEAGDAPFKRLTDAEARTLTRRELLDRVEAEQAYWHAGHRDRKDPDGYREFCKIMHYLDPGAGMQDLIDRLEGRGDGDYWDTRPGEEPDHA